MTPWHARDVTRDADPASARMVFDDFSINVRGAADYDIVDSFIVTNLLSSQRYRGMCISLGGP